MKEPGDIVVYDGYACEVVEVLFFQGIQVGYKLMHGGPSQQQIVFDVALSDPKFKS